MLVEIMQVQLILVFDPTLFVLSMSVNSKQFILVMLSFLSSIIFQLFQIGGVLKISDHLKQATIMRLLCCEYLTFVFIFHYLYSFCSPHLELWILSLLTEN